MDAAMQYSTAQFLVEGAGVNALLSTSLQSFAQTWSFVFIKVSGLRPSRSCDAAIPTLGGLSRSYLLGLLAMIKCSICSYQCDNWYVSNRKLACHINFSWGCWFVSLLASTSRVALAWHFAKRGAPFGVPSIFFSYGASCVPGCRRIFSAPAIEHHFVSLFNIGKMK